MRPALLLFFILFVSSLFAQDSTRSQVFKDNLPRKYPVFRAKYPSYPLIAGYILVREANSGDPFAEHELGIRYLIGKDFPADTVKAVYWIHKAVEQKLPAALFNYGILLYNGIGVPWNPFEAYDNFQAAANAGLPEADFAIGISYTDNLLINRNLNKAYFLFKKSADSGYQPAKDALEQMNKSGFKPVLDSASAAMLSNGKNINDDETAQLMDPQWDLDFYSFDSDTNKVKSPESIKEILNKKSDDLKKFLGLNEEKSLKGLKDTSATGILKFAAEAGSPEALLIYGRSYETGILAEKNPIAAGVNYLTAYRMGSYKAAENLYKLSQSQDYFNLLKKEIDKGNADAMYTLAGLTALGFNYQITDKQAFELLQKAAEKNHIPSIIEIGLSYYSGKLVDKNREKALMYWKKAEELGSREAAVRIAFSNILDAEGSPSEIARDIFTLQVEADAGSVLAQTALGYCYEKGTGVKESKGLAVRLYRMASQRGNETAFNSLKRMYDELRPKDPKFKIYESDQ